MNKETLMSQTATIKEPLMLSEEAKSMFVELLVSIDFRIADNDFETLQLFFKRVYSGIEELRKRNKELSEELEKLKLIPEKEQLEPIVINPLESLIISESYSRN